MSTYAIVTMGTAYMVTATGPDMVMRSVGTYRTFAAAQAALARYTS